MSDEIEVRPGAGTVFYVQLPEELIEDGNVSPAALKLWAVLKQHVNRKRGVAWPSHALLAEKMHLSDRHVRNLLGELEATGWITTTAEKGRKSTYAVHMIQQTPETQFRGSDSTPEPQFRGPRNHSSDDLNRSTQTEKTSTSEAADAPADKPQEPTRMDVEKLCSVLQASMVANGCKKPTITKAWRDEARRLIDRDERPLDQALAVLAWSQADGFWKKNIQSIPKFREKYDRLRMAWEESGPVTAPRSNSEESIRDWLRAMWQEGTVTAIEERSGLRFPHPNLPDGIRTKEAAREFHVQARRDWITANADRIVSTILERAA